MKQQRWEEAEKRNSQKRRSQRRERVRRKKIKVCEKVQKARNTVFFLMFCGSGGSKDRLVEAAGAGPAGGMIDEKLQAVLARSAFGSQSAQSTSASERFWMSDIQKVARSTFQS